MNKVASFLTDYVIYKGIVKEEERSIYEYGFQFGLETALSVLISLFIAIIFNMVNYGMLFFLIFIPLRSYAGGLHLKRYWACLALSCLTYSAILLIVKFLKIAIDISFIVFVILAALVWILFPVENGNRIVDQDEARYFKRRLRQFLLLDVILVIVMLVFHKEKYLLLTTTTFLIIVITMLIGKFKNKNV